MNKINKIIINIDKSKKDFPALISYENEIGIQTPYKLDKETIEHANEVLKAIIENHIILHKNSQLYCYNYKNNKIETIDSIKEENNHYLIGSNLEGIEDLIRKIKYTVNKRNFLIPLQIILNKKTFYLNDEIIKKKKGITDIKTIDLESYILFLREFHSH